MNSREPRFAVWCALGLAGLVFAGCAAGPDFRRPEPPAIDRYDQTQIALPDAGAGQTAQTLHPGTAPASAWWKAFDSAPLDATVDLALRDSPTLAAANATLGAAQETLAAVAGARYPQFDLNGGISRGNAAGKSTAASAANTLYSIGGMVSYTLDLFGGTRRRIEQQAALADYQRGLAGAAYLSLTGDVVTAAITIATTAESIAAANDIIAADQQNLQLVQMSMAAGKSSGTDVLTAEGQLANDRALLPPLRQQLDAARHALAILVGRSPAQWAAPDFRLQTLTLARDLPLTLPSALVRDRPDILAAEAELHAASAAVGVTTAQLYPNLTLNASWSAAAASGSALFDPGSNVWSIAAGVTAPLLHGGALRAERRAAIDTFAAQLAAYRQTVLLAFGQVADTLSALQHDTEAVQAQQAAFDVSRASLELTRQSFQSGQSSFPQVLETQRLFEQSRLGLARAVGARYLDTTLLFLALGGDTMRSRDPPVVRPP